MWNSSWCSRKKSWYFVYQCRWILFQTSGSANSLCAHFPEKKWVDILTNIWGVPFRYFNLNIHGGGGIIWSIIQNFSEMQGCIFLHDFLLPSHTSRRHFVIFTLKIISKMSEIGHSYSISVKFGVADLVWCEYSLHTWEIISWTAVYDQIWLLIS